MDTDDRDGLVIGLMKTGVTRTEANIIIDMAGKAVDDSVEALTRVIASSPAHLQSDICNGALIMLTKRIHNMYAAADLISPVTFASGEH